MKISELIQQLMQIQSEYGDLKVYTTNNDPDWEQDYLPAVDAITAVVSDDNTRGAIIF